MPTRNTTVLRQILEALGIAKLHALAKPEDRFTDRLLAVAGDPNLIASQAKELRLANTPAINTLFTGRFIEP